MRLLATAALCTALVAPPRLRQKPRRCMALASTKASAAQRAWNATRAAPLLLPGCVLRGVRPPGAGGRRPGPRRRGDGGAVAGPKTVASLGTASGPAVGPPPRRAADGGVRGLVHELGRRAAPLLLLQWRGVPSPFPFLRRAAAARAPLGDLPPFGPLLGWQGIVPAKAPRMARDLVEVTTDCGQRARDAAEPGPGEGRRATSCRPRGSITAAGAAAWAGPGGRSEGGWWAARRTRRASRSTRRRARDGDEARRAKSRADGPGPHGAVRGRAHGFRKRPGGPLPGSRQAGLRLLVDSAWRWGAPRAPAVRVLAGPAPAAAGGAGRNATAEPERRWVTLVGSGVVGCVTNCDRGAVDLQPRRPAEVRPGSRRRAASRRQSRRRAASPGSSRRVADLCGNQNFTARSC